MKEQDLIHKIEWVNKRCSLKGEPLTQSQIELLKFVFADTVVNKNFDLANVSISLERAKKLNAIEMLEKLQFSNNVVTSNMAKRILNNESTISQEWDKNPGSFVKSVLIGDYAIAISLADLDNKKVLEGL